MFLATNIFVKCTQDEQEWGKKTKLFAVIATAQIEKDKAIVIDVAIIVEVARGGMGVGFPTTTIKYGLLYLYLPNVPMYGLILYELYFLH